MRTIEAVKLTVGQQYASAITPLSLMLVHLKKKLVKNRRESVSTTESSAGKKDAYISSFLKLATDSEGSHKCFQYQAEFFCVLCLKG